MIARERRACTQAAGPAGPSRLGWPRGRIGTGVPSGLQNQCARLEPGWVGSIPTRPRHPWRKVPPSIHFTSLTHSVPWYARAPRFLTVPPAPSIIYLLVRELGEPAFGLWKRRGRGIIFRLPIWGPWTESPRYSTGDATMLSEGYNDMTGETLNSVPFTPHVRSARARPIHKPPVLRHMTKLAVAIGAIGLVGCEDPELERGIVVGKIDFDDPTRRLPQIPDTATVGIPVEIAVSTGGSGCYEYAWTAGGVDRRSATVIPWTLSLSAVARPVASSWNTGQRGASRSRGLRRSRSNTVRVGGFARGSRGGSAQGVRGGGFARRLATPV